MYWVSLWDWREFKMVKEIDLKRDQNGRFIKGNTGFWLGKARDKATMVKIINTARARGSYNKPNSGQFKKGSQINLGRKLSFPEKLYIGERTKKGMTPEIRKHISDEAQIRVKNGTHHIFKVCAKKGENRNPQNNYKKGHMPWNKGEEFSEDVCKKMSDQKKKFYQEHPEAIVKWYNKTRKNIIIPFKDTKIEIKIQNFLKELGIEFYTHQYIQEIEHGYHCDVFIPTQKGINQKTIIECDGDYWHGNTDIPKFSNLNESQKKQAETDKIHTQELEDKGFRVIRLWENEINRMSVDRLKEKLIENYHG